MKVITICGSMRHWNTMMKMYTKLSNEGNIVMLPVINADSKETAKVLQIAKIKKSDQVFVVNQDGYIGEDTMREIKYANSLHKKIVYMEG